MADVNVTVDVAAANITINETANATLSGRAVATPEGLLIAYSSLILMAIVPIWFGAFRSVVFNKKQKDSGEKVESMSKKDAAMFPIVASCALLGLYIFFKVFGKEYVNLLLTFYFFVIGVLCVTNLLSPIVKLLVGNYIPNSEYRVLLLENSKEEHINQAFDRMDIIALILAGAIGAWYLIKKHWIANNIFGLSFSLTGIELLHLNSFPIGCILLCGLFVYDIFWVFGTDVMVTVATSFDAPIKVIFPMDFLEHGIFGKNMAMLGLGDIVIPGIFIALLLRFDCCKSNGTSRAYFYASYVAYFLGLSFTVLIMHVFKSAQPALLYLVPACLGSALLTALVRGELGLLFKYEDHPAEMLRTGDSPPEGDTTADTTAEDTTADSTAESLDSTVDEADKKEN